MTTPAIPPMVPGAGPRVITTNADVLARFDRVVKKAATATRRDALVDALTGIALAAQLGGEYAAAQSDTGRATERYLDALANDHEIGRGDGELDEQLAVRLSSRPETVTQEAIVKGVNAILAVLGVGECQVYDASLDRWFVHADGAAPTAIWHSYIGIGPSYPDRFLSDDGANTPGGRTIPNSDPGGAVAFADCLGRYFVVRVPDLAGVDATIAYGWTGQAIGGIQPEDVGEGFFARTGAGAPEGAYVSATRVPADAAYEAIANFLHQIAGQSIRWALWSDSRL